ncbi:hypothetical protein [Herbaspirillum sp. NPDC087042]|uniref:hypothetical protein n=1 Tax=Herbaspirillum sp. NPDC087042 TaxID=3364004 RepID=UPI0037FA3669
MEYTILAVNAVDADLRNVIECVFIGKYLQFSDGARQLAEAMPDRYRFLGKQPNEEALRYLASVDAYVLASYSEPQSLTLWKSFELDLPVCLSYLETYRHIGLRHAQNVMMHPMGNLEILSSNLRMMLTSGDMRRSVTRGQEIVAQSSGQRLGR